MADYRIIDADGHVMELDSELREFIGAPYNDLEWHHSYSFWPGLTMDGFLRSLRKKGGWAGNTAPTMPRSVTARRSSLTASPIS